MKKSFTLIELLMVIAIIGLLAALVIPNLTQIRAKARDAKRVEDLRQLQNALEMYYSDHQAYPSGEIGSNSQDGFCLERSLNEDGSCPSDKFCDLIKPYLARLPKDPLFKWSDTSSPCYLYLTDTNTTSTAQAYKAAAKMEKDFSRAENDGGTDNNRYEISDTQFKGLSLSFLPQKSHIVGFWQFEETSNPIVDQTGVNSGTYNGTLWQQTGKIDYCLGFDGSNDRVDFGNICNVTTGEFTVAIWFKRLTGGGSYNAPIMKRQGVSYGAGYGIDINAPAYQVRFMFLQNSSKRWEPGTSGNYGDNNWHLAVMGRRGTALFWSIDGGVENGTYDPGIAWDFSNTQNLYLGYFPEYNSYYSGNVDEVIFWNVALTNDEISTLYANGAPTRSLYSY